MKIATYNLRFGGKSGNRVHWQKMLDSVNPDILLLQETLLPEEYLSEEVCQTHRQQIHWAAVDNRPWGSAVYKDKTRPFHCDGIFVPAGWYRYLEKAEVLSGDDWETIGIC